MLNFKEMYELGIKKGMEADPRGIKKVKTYLERVKKEYADLKPADKKYFEEVWKLAKKQPKTLNMWYVYEVHAKYTY